MAAERVLLIDVPGEIASALAQAGIDTAAGISPAEAAVALVGRGCGNDVVAGLRAAAPGLPVVGLDGVAGADSSAGPGSAVAAVRPWLAEGMVAALERLSGVFGREAVVGLATGLAAMVAEGEPDVMRAHRIAGLAGTLGLSALNEPWLAVSEGDRDALPRALRAAARARVAIAQFATT